MNYILILEGTDTELGRLSGYPISTSHRVTINGNDYQIISVIPSAAVPNQSTAVVREIEGSHPPGSSWPQIEFPGAEGSPSDGLSYSS